MMNRIRLFVWVSFVIWGAIAIFCMISVVNGWYPDHIWLIWNVSLGIILIIIISGVILEYRTRSWEKKAD